MAISFKALAEGLVRELQAIADSDFNGSVEATFQAALLALGHLHLDIGEPLPEDYELGAASDEVVAKAIAAFVAYRREFPDNYRENLPYLRNWALTGRRLLQ